MRKGVLRNFSKFTGNDLCQKLFFNNSSATLLKSDSVTVVFQVFSKNTFFTEHLLATTSGKSESGKFEKQYILNLVVKKQSIESGIRESYPAKIKNTSNVVLLLVKLQASARRCFTVSFANFFKVAFL